MSDFDEYIKNKYPSDYLLMKVRYPNQELSELYSDQFEVWQHQQAIIDNLKTQLNNMEASYIEKKKVEELQGRIDEALEDLEYPTAPWDETIASVVKVLRGES